ncbi:MAG: polyprenyl synthetase family protein [Gammaproteobacteria bacterium]|nr:polyprenyl synthetase family protein [Gammaproteobacteria bacterium]
MEIAAIRSLVSTDLAAVDALIRQRLHSEVVLVNQIGHYIINNGGKRLRPLLALLCAHACGYTGNKHIDIAAIIEFIHTATLIHDDIVDASELRRGKETANSLWGNEASVLVGDFLYSRAFEMMVEVGDIRVMAIMARATNIIAEGEVMQLLNCHDADTTEQRYLDVIHYKTAKLFEAAAQLGGILSRDDGAAAALSRYGMHLGTAFQLVDDILDYSATSEVIGKNIGDDLAEGKPTLPLIYALQHSPPQQASVLRHAIENGGRDDIAEVIATIESSGALAYTAQAAQREAQQAAGALHGLAASPYKDALFALTDYAVSRSY